MCMLRRTLVVAFLVLTASVEAADRSVDYLRDIKPILRERCYACHGALQQQAGLRLDTAALVREGSDNGVVITPGFYQAGPGPGIQSRAARSISPSRSSRSTGSRWPCR